MKLNNKLTALLILSTISFATIVKADEIIIPVVSKPAVLQEGTQRELTVAQIAELLPWAKDSKVFLVDLLDSTQGLSSSDKLDRLVDGMKYVVGESAPKNSELLMRYTINRGLVINDILAKESSAAEVGSVDAKVRVLVSSIKMAIKYYETDMATLSKKSPAPFVTFGLDYFNFLTELNKSIFDATAQYSIQRTSLEWLQWDLYRDLNNTSYAAQIVKINNSLKVYPAKATSDKQAISFIRQMKGLSMQLDLREGAVRRNNVVSNDDEVESNDAQSVDETIFAVKDPAINGVRFSHNSDVNGSCKALGYQKGVPGSAANASSNQDEALLLYSTNGTLSNVAHTGYHLTSITCLNKISASEDTGLIKINDPVIPGGTVPFSYNSDTTTVCNTQGYEKGFKDSVTTTSTALPVVVAQAKGLLNVGTTAGYRMTSIVCQNPIYPTQVVARNISNPTIQGQNILHNASVTGVCKLLGYKYGARGASSNTREAGVSLQIDDAGSVTGSEVNSYKMTNVICVK